VIAVQMEWWKFNALIVIERIISLTVYCKTPNFVFKRNEEGTLHLDPSHAYCFQVQTQIYVCEVEYCDYTERVFSDQDFWLQCGKSAEFFKVCILPKILGRWYIRQNRRESVTQLESAASDLRDKSNN